MEYPVLQSSYENKNSLKFDALQIRSLRGLGFKLNADEQDKNERAVAFADFFGEEALHLFSQPAQGMYTESLGSMTAQVRRIFSLAMTMVDGSSGRRS